MKGSTMKTKTTWMCGFAVQNGGYQPHEAMMGYLNCKWSIGEFTFSRFGAYWIELLIDGSLSHRLLLEIQQDAGQR